MVETILILAFSLALFLYWFRYTVLLLLSEEKSRTSGDGHLPIKCAADPESLAARGREYAARSPASSPSTKITGCFGYLLDHAAGMGLQPLEHHLLILDYRIMKVWYRLTRSLSTRQAQRALQEMAGVVSHIAYKMGERTASLSQA